MNTCSAEWQAVSAKEMTPHGSDPEAEVDPLNQSAFDRAERGSGDISLES
jgi:hypothetical protein